MARKLNFDFKQFLVQKGERVALGVAVAVMLTLVVMAGVGRARGGGGAGANTEALKSLGQAASLAMQNSTPPANIGTLPPDLQSVRVATLDKDWFPAAKRYFDRGSQADRKWRMPRVLAPDEFAAAVVRGGVQAYYLLFDDDGKPIKVAVVQEAAKEMSLEQQVALAQQHPELKRFKKELQRQLLQMQLARAGSGPGAGGGGGGGGGGLGGGGEGRSAGRARGGGGGGGPAAGGGPGFFGGPGGGGAAPALMTAGPDKTREIKFVPVDQVDKAGKMAQRVLPARAAVISCAYPYKRQLEEYRQALRFDSLAEVINDADARPEFLGILVERRKVNADGAPIEGEEWAPLDLKSSMQKIRVQAVSLEPEDRELVADGVIIKGLVMPRPKLARDQKYPPEELAGIRETVAAYRKARETHVPPPPPKKSRFDHEFDVWSESEEATAVAAAPPPGAPAEPPAAAEPAKPAEQAKEVLVPEKCLIRFLDPTIKPGDTYEYRLKVRLANPAYGKEDRAVSREVATEAEIRPADDEWAVVSTASGRPLRITVRDELLYYAVDEKLPGTFQPPATAENVPVQIHRWLDWIQVADTPVAVGDWSVLPRELVHRGEYVGRVEEALVPVWDPAADGYVLASKPEDTSARARLAARFRRQGVPVDYFRDPLASSPDIEPGSIVVDFDGGKRTVPGSEAQAGAKPAVEETPLELLTLRPDGRLVTRNGKADTDDAERKARVESWRNWVTEVQRGAQKAKDKGADMFDKTEREGGRGKGRRPSPP